jgi:hypothetical protein
MDACTNPEAVRALAASRPDVVAVSGATGEGLEELLQLVADKLAENMVDMQVGVGCGGWWGGFQRDRDVLGGGLISIHLVRLVEGLWELLRLVADKLPTNMVDAQVRWMVGMSDGGYDGWVSEVGG